VLAAFTAMEQEQDNVAEGSEIGRSQHYAVLSHFNKLALSKLFYNSLKNGVKDLLLTLPDITSL
jgi:hypothetical protein